MGAVGVRLRSELRNGWRAWIGLALLLGMLGGVVLAAAAGARRTDSAYPRMLAATRAPDFLVAAGSTGTADAFYDELARLPDVADAGTVAGAELVWVRPDRTDLLDARVGLDDRLGSTVARPKLLTGRMPDPARPDEILANRQMGELVGGEVGARISVLARPTFEADLAEATPLTLTVVGIGVFPQEVVPSSLLDASPQVVLTPAYARERAGDERAYDGIFLRLRPGADRAEFRQEVEALAGRHRDRMGENLFIGDEADLQAKAQRAIQPQSLALGAFAVLAAATALLVVGQSFSRQLSGEAVEYPVLRAVGMTPNQLLLLALSRATLVGGVGAAVAVALALALSPLTPIGRARLAEPDPGLSADFTVLGLGFLAIVVLLVGWAVIPAWRQATVTAQFSAAGDRSGDFRRSRLAAAITRTTLPPAASVGARMALEAGSGSRAVPVRSTLAGTAVALAAGAAALTFVANLGRLVTTPSLYGRDWNVALDAGFSAVPLEDAAAVLRSEPAVEAFTGGNYGDVTIEGRAVPAVGVDILHGDTFPTLLEGRPPRADNEIVLGTKSLRELSRSVGDTVTVDLDGGPSAMRVVGRAVFPKMGRGSFPPTGLGEGAVVVADLLPPVEDPSVGPIADPAYGFFLIRFADDAGVEDRNRVMERLMTEVCASVREVDCFLDSDQRPADISNYAEVRRTPVLLAGLLIVLAVATLSHALATSVRRRRRDLALLRAVGFVRRQVSSTVAWQATTLAAVAGMVGVPVGVAAGRWAWVFFADQLGVAAEVVIPLLPLLLAIPVAVLTANLVAALPARSAGRARPALALRTE